MAHQLNYYDEGTAQNEGIFDAKLATSFFRKNSLEQKPEDIKTALLYMNMGHGDKIFTSPVQNTLIENATTWLLGKN